MTVALSPSKPSPDGARRSPGASGSPAGGERRRLHRPAVLRNAMLLGALWVAYSAVRTLTVGDTTAATDNAETIISVQRALGLPSEAALQSMFLVHTWIIKAANFYYLAAHFPVTIMFLVWAWWRHHDRFGRIRNALIATTGVALAVHVMFPLTPPRMMNGFVDTAKVFGPDPYELSIANAANQLAAMPSLHVGWALLVALGVVWASRRTWRWIALAHPAATLMVVVLTANHYWLDAAAAAVIVAAAWWITRSWRRSANEQTDPERRIVSVGT